MPSDMSACSVFPVLFNCSSKVLFLQDWSPTSGLWSSIGHPSSGWMQLPSSTRFFSQESLGTDDPSILVRALSPRGSSYFLKVTSVKGCGVWGEDFSNLCLGGYLLPLSTGNIFLCGLCVGGSSLQDPHELAADKSLTLLSGVVGGPFCSSLEMSSRCLQLWFLAAHRQSGSAWQPPSSLCSHSTPCLCLQCSFLLLSCDFAPVCSCCVWRLSS